MFSSLNHNIGSVELTYKSNIFIIMSSHDIRELSILKKNHVFAPMGRFQIELIYLYFPPSSHLVYLCFRLET